MRPSAMVLLLVLFLSELQLSAQEAGGAGGSLFPAVLSGWKTDGATRSFGRKNVYDELDGGAEVYLEYGLVSLKVQKYSKPGEPPITFELFEMDGAAGAYGAFTFEQQDEEAGVGQGSEYGGGLLRFWQGRFFGFLQAERETAASREALLALGKAVALRLGPPGKVPTLVRAFPTEGRRPRSLRYVRSPLLLQIVDPKMEGNPLGLPAKCEAACARYGPRGSPERILIARFSDADAAQRGLTGFQTACFPKEAKSAEAIKDESGYSAATSVGPFLVVVSGARDALAAQKRLEEVLHLAEEVGR